MELSEGILEFLKSRRLTAIISSQDEKEKLKMISNVYYDVDEGLKFYFIGEKPTNSGDKKVSNQFVKNPKIKFAILGINKKDYDDKEGIEGEGKMKIAVNEEEIRKGRQLYKKEYPDSPDIKTENLEVRVINVDQVKECKDLSIFYPNLGSL